MPESSQHIRLVADLKTWLQQEYGRDIFANAHMDTAGSSGDFRPPLIDGYVPDIFLPSSANSSVVIGEAKTAADIETRHSIAQLEAFLRFASSANGRLVVAVPFCRFPTAHNLIARLHRKMNVVGGDWIVLRHLPG